MNGTLRQARKISTWTAQASLFLLVCIVLISLQYEVERNDTLLIGLSLALANLPGLVLIIAAVFQRQTFGTIKALQVGLDGDATLSDLARTRYLSVGQSGPITKQSRNVAQLLVGRAVYTKETASQPDIGLFVNAGVLDKNPLERYGDAVEGILYSVRSFDGQSYAYLAGDLERITAICNGLWDHGHVRSLTEADRKFHITYASEQAEMVRHTVAYAVAALPDGSATASFKLRDITSPINFVGIASYDIEIHPEVPAALKTAANAGIRTIIFSDDPEPVAGAVAKLAYGGIVPVVLSDSLLGRLRPKQLAEMVDKSFVVFSRLPAKSRKHVLQALNRYGPTLHVDDSPSTVTRGRLPNAVRAVRIARQAGENFAMVYRTVLVLTIALLILSIFGTILLTAYDINPVITPLQIVTVALIGMLPAWLMAGHDKSHTNLMKRPAEAVDKQTVDRHTFGSIVVFGAIGAALATGNHIVFFLRRSFDPAFLASDTPLYIQAATLTGVTLLLCMYVYLLSERADTHKRLFTNYLSSNKKLLTAIIGSLFVLAIFMYVPALRVVLNLQPLDAIDWLSAVFAAGLFLSFRLAQRFLKIYSRHAVIQLHREVHGTK